jgi:hypothetical protein
MEYILYNVAVVESDIYKGSKSNKYSTEYY